MRKKDPKIIRVGDKVKIVNPETFVRCGYPLTKADLYGDVIGNFSRQMDDLLRHTGMTSSQFHLVQHKITDALAYGLLKQRGFGGEKRSIYTDTWKDLQDRIGIVNRIKFVKTGVYNSASVYEDDYDPPYLSPEETHKILYLYIPFLGNMVWIEAKNVEKIQEEK